MRCKPMKKMRKRLPDMNKQELYRLARDLEIPGRSRLSRDELIKALRAARRRKRPPAAEETTARKVTPRMPLPKPVSRRKRPKLRPPKQAKKTVRRRSAKATSVSVPPPATAETPGLSLPLEYGRDVLVALVRDPRCVYCYWELSGGARDALRRAHGQDVLERSGWVLRAHDLAAGAHQDVAIHPDALGWYLDLEADRAWRIEIGVVTPDGQFLRLAVGDTVRTPPTGIGRSAEGAWAVRDGEGACALAHHLSSSDLLAERVSQSGRPLSEPRTPRE